MGSKIIFMMDNVNHKGGAHFVTLEMFPFLHEDGFDIAVFTGYAPEDSLISDYPYCTFLTAAELPANDSVSLLNLINNYDIVCVPFEDSIFRNTVSQSKAYKIQWIHIDYEIWKDSSPYARKCTADDKQIYAGFDRIIFVAGSGEKGFLSLYPELSAKTCVCYNPLDVSKIKKLAGLPLGEAETRLFSSSDNLNIITVTRMSNLQKGITRTLEIIEKLKADGYEFTWTFAGDGVDFDALQRYSRALDLDSHVYWLGFTDNPYKYMKNADLFALLSHYEGNPLVLYESLLTGTPVLSTYYKTSEKYIPENTGWYVDNDEAAIYEKLRYLLDNRDIIDTARTNLSNYSYDTQLCRKRILEVFRDGAG